MATQLKINLNECKYSVKRVVEDSVSNPEGVWTVFDPDGDEVLSFEAKADAMAYAKEMRDWAIRNAEEDARYQAEQDAKAAEEDEKDELEDKLTAAIQAMGLAELRAAAKKLGL